MQFKISAGQFQVIPGAYEDNFRKAEAFIRQASERKSKLILLPELWLGGYDYRLFEDYQKEAENCIARIEALARSLKIAIVGTYPLHKNGHSFNTMVWIDTSGNSVFYNKLHLFSLMRERDYFSAGERLVTLPAPWGETGLAVCYDLRFPELFRKYALAGVKVILISAEWPLSRIDHWKTLLRARAIENQIFVIGCNAVGRSGKEIMGGASAIIDPWGRTLTEADSESEVLITSQLDLNEVQNARESISVFKDRRTDIYG
jgi:omega-amidase